MNTFIIYHNPKCSKSRKALEILHSHHLNPVVIDYMKTPLNMGQLIKIRSYFNLSDFVRTTEPIFKHLGLTLNDEGTVLNAILKEPILMQRPIITCNDKAIIARPLEKIVELIS